MGRIISTLASQWIFSFKKELGLLVLVPDVIERCVFPEL